MAERTITYTATKQAVSERTLFDPPHVKIWMCDVCGAAVINQDLHNDYHKVGR